MKLKSALVTIAALSMAAIIFAQTSQNSSSTSSSRSGNGQSSSSASGSASSSSRASGSKSVGGNASGSFRNGGSGSGNGSGSGFGMNGKPTHAIMYTLDSGVASTADLKQKAFDQHTKYLGEQQGKGKVLLFGPWRDLPGSMAIVMAQSDEEANEIARNDPAVRSGQLTFEVRAWQVMNPAMASRR